jgi:drug/metabolite transporter (DMT)-like permease
MLLGLLLALAASALFNVAVAVQALDARTLSHELSLRVGLLRALIRRRRWRFGMLLALLGWPLHAAALGSAPLTAVQPALAAGLLILLFVASRTLGERVGPREVAAVLLIIAGEAGIAWAAPDRSSTHAHGAGLVATLVVLGAIALFPYFFRHRPHARGLAPVVSAGVAFAISGFVTKLVSDDLSSGAIFTAWLWADLVGVAAVIGVLSENTSFQSRPASQVAPLVFSAQTVIPVLLAPLVGGESWSNTPLSGGAVLIALAAVVAGVILIARSRAVGSLISRHATELGELAVESEKEWAGKHAHHHGGGAHRQIQMRDADRAREGTRDCST